jgi:hypothetical protein
VRAAYNDLALTLAVCYALAAFCVYQPGVDRHVLEVKVGRSLGPQECFSVFRECRSEIERAVRDRYLTELIGAIGEVRLVPADIA